MVAQRANRPQGARGPAGSRSFGDLLSVTKTITDDPDRRRAVELRGHA